MVFSDPFISEVLKSLIIMTSLGLSFINSSWKIEDEIDNRNSIGWKFLRKKEREKRRTSSKWPVYLLMNDTHNRH